MEQMDMAALLGAGRRDAGRDAARDPAEGPGPASRGRGRGAAAAEGRRRRMEAFELGRALAAVAASRTRGGRREMDALRTGFLLASAMPPPPMPDWGSAPTARAGRAGRAGPGAGGEAQAVMAGLPGAGRRADGGPPPGPVPVGTHWKRQRVGKGRGEVRFVLIQPYLRGGRA